MHTGFTSGSSPTKDGTGDVQTETIVIHTLNFAQVKSMDDNCGEWVECMGVASGSGWNLWMCLVGVVVRRYYIYISSSYLSLLCSFFQQHPYFLFIKKCFFVLVPVLFVIIFYELNNFYTQYKHTQASHHSHMKAAHNVLYKKKHTQTNASYPAMVISCMPSRVCEYIDLEVEGVR